jgi:hypothetical protein
MPTGKAFQGKAQDDFVNIFEATMSATNKQEQPISPETKRRHAVIRDSQPLAAAPNCSSRRLSFSQWWEIARETQAPYFLLNPINCAKFHFAMLVLEDISDLYRMVPRD